MGGQSLLHVLDYFSGGDDDGVRMVNPVAVLEDVRIYHGGSVT